MGKYRAYPEYKNSGVEWLEEIPKHWGAKKLKFISSVQPSNIDKKSKEDEVPVELCNYTDVYYNEEIDSSLTFMKASATNEQIKKFTLRAGDTIITKDSEDPRDIAIPAYVPKTLTGVVCGYHLAMIRPKDSDMGSYIKRVFETGYARSYFSTRANGLTRYGLGTYPLSNIYFPIPPKDEARNIAAFLDHETAKIDRLIARQERLIELLKEKRQAAISHAVTKGLNPDAPMKDSGVEWLREVPAHWDVKSIKRLTVVKRGASPRPIDDPKYFDEEGRYAWVRIADSTASGGRLHVTTQRLSDLGSSLSVPLQPGDLFLSIAGTVGLPCITEIPACIHDGFVYFPGWREDREFLFYIFQAGECYKGLGKFGTQLNLNTDTVGFIKIGVPPRGEQELIVGYLHEKLSKLDNLVAKVAQAVTLLQEHRTTLISAAVTGKIDVRGWQQPSIEPQAAATAASA